MLSQSPCAIKQRLYRAKYPRLAEPKPLGRRVNFDKHRALVSAVEKVIGRRFGNMAILACDLGYAHADSLLKAYKLSKAALSQETTARRRVAEASSSTPSSADRGRAR